MLRSYYASEQTDGQCHADERERFRTSPAGLNGLKDDLWNPNRPVDLFLGMARDLGIGLLAAEDTSLGGRTLRVEGREQLNFSSCSYLGLELDPRLIEGAVEATRRFGTQFSVSRAFLSAPPYAELESLLGEITGGPTLVTPNTTLASASALPSLIGEGDAVLLDQQVTDQVATVLPVEDGKT